MSFRDEIVAQVRALDNHGFWDKLSDEELLTKKYVKTKEDLKAIPIIADIKKETTDDIRLIFQAIALGFEKITGVMATVVMEMSHEGFGRAVVIADKIVIADKYFKDAHRFGYRDLEKFFEEGDKLLAKSVEIYKEIKG